MCYEVREYVDRESKLLQDIVWTTECVASIIPRDEVQHLMKQGKTFKWVSVKH